MFLTIVLIAIIAFACIVISINHAGGSSELDYSEDDIILAKWLKDWEDKQVECN